MKKFFIEIKISMDFNYINEKAAHLKCITDLIKKKIVDTHLVSEASQRILLTVNANTKYEAQQLLTKSPYFQHYPSIVDEIMEHSGALYEKPHLTLN
jgi:hypothetical protein